MKVDRLDTEVFRFPTPTPQADGTAEWDATTVVTVTARAGDLAGLGWTYSTRAAAAIIRDVLEPALSGLPLDNVAGAWQEMRRACRNFGTRGLVMQAISAVDIALWDLKARARGQALVGLFGPVRDAVPVYGSGGFVSMTDTEMVDQLHSWLALGCTMVKIKIGEHNGQRVSRDLDRVELACRTVGRDAEVFVDANGAYSVGQARRIGRDLDDCGVTWFEEPVTSLDVPGLAGLRDSLRCDVAAGEYISDLAEAAELVTAVDCLQLDVTRCGGYTGFLRAAAVAQAHQREVSAHCAPALVAPLAAAIPNFRHIEYFADHARLEPLLVHDVPKVEDGQLRPNQTIGHGYWLRPNLRQWRIEGER